MYTQKQNKHNKMASKYSRRTSGLRISDMGIKEPNTAIKDDKLDTLIHKIYPFMSRYETKMIRRIMDCNNNNTSRMTEISLLVTNYVGNHAIQPDKHRQDFIVKKINKFLNSYLQEQDQSTWKFVDIGGGNGNVVSGLNESHKLDEYTNNKPIDSALYNFDTRFKENYICVETLTDWGETYPFNHENITYLFLHGEDPVYLCIEPQSVDVILCMCSLHHMTDDTIVQMLHNMKRILKPCGKILVKEHDAIPGSITYIEWEHHLYHILDCAYAGKLINADSYFNKSIHNFKTKEHWTDMFFMGGFALASTHNRFLDGDMFQDTKNITELYWAVYENAPTL